MPDISTDDIDETARMLGVRRSAAPPVKGSNPTLFTTPDDLEETARQLGVSLPGKAKPGAKAAAAPKNIVVPGRQTVAPSGKVDYEPGDVITPKEQAAGLQRGMPGQFVSGIPIGGPLFNYGEAAVTPGKSFDQALHDIRRADKAFATQHPFESTLAQFAGGAGAYGLGALTAPGRVLMGAAGPSTATRIWTGVPGNAAISGADAWMRGEDPLAAGTIGAAGGFLGPTIGEGAGVLTHGALGRATTPGALADVPWHGIDLLATRGLGDMTPAEIAAARRQAGPHALLGDITPGMRDLTQGVGAVQGPGKDLVQRAYTDQAGGGRQRTEDLLNRTVSPRLNIEHFRDAITDARAAVADPLYEAWRAQEVEPTQELRQMIPALGRLGLLREGEEHALMRGVPFLNPENPATGASGYPTTESWDAIKRAIDTRIERAYSSGQNTRAADLVILKNRMINEIRRTRAGPIWDQAREAFAEQSELINQMNAGRDTFLGGRAGASPDQLREELRGLSRPELQARVVGMRSAMAEGMDATRNGDATMRGKLLAPVNQHRIRLTLEAAYPRTGAVRADDLIRGLQQEAFLAERAADVIPNRNTGASAVARGEAADLFRAPSPLPWDVTRPSSYPLLGRLLPQNVLEDVRVAGRARSAPALAHILTTPEGPRMDDLIDAIMAARGRLNTAGRVGGALDRATSAAVAGPVSSTYRRYYENQKPEPALSER